MRSFRSALAFRVAVQALGFAVLILIGAGFLLRLYLLDNVDASLRAIAEIDARAGASPTSAEFRFHPQGFPAPVRDVSPEVRPRVQLVSPDGKTLARTATLSEDLPVPLEALAAAKAGRPAFATHRLDGRSLRTIMFPLSTLGPSHDEQYLQVTTSLAPMMTTLRRFVALAAVLELVGVAVIWYASWRIAGRALQPALAIASEAASIGPQELHRRVSVPGDLAEIAGLASAFNATLERIEQAVTGTRRFTSDASHELRAPLTVLRGELELALSRPRSATEYEEVLRRCLDEVLRLVRLADDLLTLARIEGGAVGGKRAPVDLQEVVERAVGRKAELALRRGVEVQVAGPAGPVRGDADLVLRAVDGLLEHAIMASPQGGSVRILLAGGATPSIEVTDSGTGLNAEEVSGVFQRFYRSKRPRVRSDESGLGLPIARAIAIAHGGALDYVGNRPGASFRLSFPATG